MTIHIIDNKRIDLTNDEWNLYQQIVARYTTPPYQKGEDLFIGLFETNEQGLIIFLRPPTMRHTSFEILMFLQNTLINQNLRLSHSRVDDLCARLEEKSKLLDQKLEELKTLDKLK
jgi:hypothetical protein